MIVANMVSPIAKSCDSPLSHQTLEQIKLDEQRQPFVGIALAAQNAEQRQEEKGSFEYQP